MTKQQKTYILLIAVLIVWGIIGFQIYNYLNPEEDIVETLSFEEYSPTLKKEKEIYEVKLHKRDPFLGKILVAPKVTTVAVKKKESVIFPQILYNGLVESGNTKTFVISIDGKQTVFKLGQVVKNIKLVKANSKEVVLEYMKERKTYTIR